MMRRFLPPWPVFAVCAAGLFFPSLFQDKARRIEWWATHALVKVRPYDPPPLENSPGVQLFAARNEFEPFQIVLRAETNDIEKVDVEVSDLKNSSGASIASSENITVYLERYLNLKSPSSSEGEAGEWPDPLIPRIDRYAGEKRRSFPFVLSGGRNQPVWIEIYVPPGAASGVYSGEATITVDGVSQGSVPIGLRVWDFSLPSTSSFPTSFGLNGVTVLKQHRSQFTNDEELDALTHLYAKAALWHRISIHGGTMSPPRFSGDSKNPRIDWSRYDREVGPFLDGTVFKRNEPLYGARATSVDLRTPKMADTNEKKVAYWKKWADHFEEKGWLDRLFYYVWDEPPSRIYRQVARQAELARLADRRIRNLVTASYDKSLKDVIDIWTPLMNCMESRPEDPNYCSHTVPRETYDSVLPEGKTVWWYQSCASHGCKGPGGDYFRGWPSYVVDGPAVGNRIMPWLAWKYRIAGELYFSMNEAFSQEGDAWENIYLFGGNGDGTLFYPGRPREIGGNSDIPIESIRLKLIREGLEDYEYLALLAQGGSSAFGDGMFPPIAALKAYQWEHDPEKLYALRQEIGERLHGKGRQNQNGVSVLDGIRQSADDSRLHYFSDD